MWDSERAALQSQLATAKNEILEREAERNSAETEKQNLKKKWEQSRSEVSDLKAKLSAAQSAAEAAGRKLRAEFEDNLKSETAVRVAQVGEGWWEAVV